MFAPILALACSAHLGVPPAEALPSFGRMAVDAPFAEPGLEDGLRRALAVAGLEVAPAEAPEALGVQARVVVTEADAVPLAIGLAEDSWRASVRLRVELPDGRNANFSGSSVYLASRVDTAAMMFARAVAFEEASGLAARSAVAWLAHGTDR